MTYFRRFICRCLSHTYVVRRFRRHRKIIGWQECLVCGHQPAAPTWRNAGLDCELPDPLCRSDAMPRILGLVKLKGLD